MREMTGIENTDTEQEARDNQSRNRVHVEVQDIRMRVIESLAPPGQPIDIVDPEMGSLLIKAVRDYEKAEQWRGDYNLKVRSQRERQEASKEQSDSIGGIASVILSALDRQRQEKLAEVKGTPIKPPVYEEIRLGEAEPNKIAVENPDPDNTDVDKFRYEMIEKGMDPKRIIVDGKIVERDLDAEEAEFDKANAN